MNVDVLPGHGVDVVTDLTKPLPFEDSTADLIYASHLLEHFPTTTAPLILKDWRRVLRDGGTLLVAVPDLEVIAECLLEYRGWFTPPHNPWLGALYGGQKDEYDFHKTGFTLPWLAVLLREADFRALERVEWFREIGSADLSRSELPFGRNVSLNVRAIAGATPLPGRLFRRGPAERAFDSVDRMLALALRASVKARSALMDRRRRRIEQSIRPEAQDT